MNRKKIKGGPGKQGVEGKLRLAKEIKYIQRRAAEHDARFVTVGPLVFFSTQTEMPGCWTPPTTSLHDLPEMGTPSPSTSKKPKPTSQSAGKVTTTLKVAHSSTQTESPDASLRSLAIPPQKLHNWAK